ncbi:hypothetical protein BBF96_07540 [Anoxybacter fermentans]|uniref:DUF1861 domain-containing protein n=1 Tax=Anoxybacter fermentans TaxID=1323375 RepID=A0A3S9SYB3_9FIRM|nr:DUF1861 family protein [Anoxybacter fermentans]AZR73250.1 hypothetical protein BBF96_07540 [Anoxybacter fermentans]
MAIFESGKKQTCKELLLDFKSKKQQLKGEKLHFVDVDGRDVYNITAPFEDAGEMVIAGRVEARDSEDSEVFFFVQEDGYWRPRKNAPKFRLQDPFVTKISGELVFGGVEIFPHPEIEGALSYRTIFYRGIDINSLKKFAIGPDGMKDIRLVELADGKIGVFTRPQGKIGGRGQIGFIKIDSLDQLNIEVINNAKLLTEQFIEEEWGGANELHLLSNGLVGVLGHIARFDEEGNRHYYPMVFAFDPLTETASSMEIIATRDNFPPGPAKRPDLVDVLFSGGLIRMEDGRAELYVGVSDAEAHKIVISDPFLKYE